MQFSGIVAKYSRLVSHKGFLLCFSYIETVLNRSAPKIGYSLLALTGPDHRGDDQWKDFELLDFPTQIRPVGMQVITLKTGDNPIPADDAPFQVLSDTNYVYVFRQSTAKTLLVDRFVLDEVALRLVPPWEVRYRRSQKTDLPADRKDSFGTLNMEGVRFVEPTTELGMIGNLQGGGFAVQILPTDVASVERWLILAWNSSNNKLDAWSIRRSANGMFDLSDTIDPTSKQVLPSASYFPADNSRTFTSGPAALFYHRQEWLKDEQGVERLFDRTARVMVAIPSSPGNQVAVLDFAVGKNGQLAAVTEALPIATAPAPTTAILLEGSHQTAIAVGVLANAPTQAVTIECWLRATTAGSGCCSILQSASGTLAFLLAVVDGVPAFSATVGGNTTAVSGPRLGLGDWTHIAGVRDTAGTLTIYVNGQPSTTSIAISKPPTPPTSGYLFGGAGGFSGALKEARLWNIARSRSDILLKMTGTIAPNDPAWGNLIGYWQMNEPTDASRLTTMPNSAGSGAAGNGSLAGAQWVPSNAPTAPSMTPVAWDSDNLDVATCLLDFALTDALPCLYEGSDSRITLYLKQASTGQLIAAHFDTLNSRARYSVPWVATAIPSASTEYGVLQFIARTPGIGMINTQVTPAFVEITPNPVTPPARPTGTLTLRSNTGVVEVWPQLPLEVVAMADVINGNAMQTTTDPVAVARDVLMYDYTAVQVTHGSVQHGTVPGPGSGSGIFAAAPATTPRNGYPGIVSGTNSGSTPLPVLSRAGVDSWWLPTSPRAALTLNESASIDVFDATALQKYVGPLAMRRDLTLEAWLNPSAFTSNTQSTVLLYNGASAAPCNYLLALDPAGRLFAGNDQKMMRAQADTALALNTWTHVAASYRTDFGIQLSGTKYLDAGNDTSLDTPEALTIEAWVKLDQAGGQQTIAAKSSASGRTWALYLNAGGAPVFEVRQDQGSTTTISTVTGGTTFAVGAWHHVAAVYDVSYKRETVLQFNATIGTNATIPALTNPISTSASVEAWVQVTAQSTPTATQLLFASTNGNDPVVLSLSLLNNVPAFGVNSSSIQGAVALRIGDWAQLAGTYDSVAGTLNLYVNGQLVANTTGVTPPSGDPITSGIAYRIGSPANLTPFGGCLSQVRLWNRGLSVDEVRANMMHELNGGERGLVGYWPLTDRFGTSIMDLAGNSNGTVNNGTFVQADKGFFNQRILVDGLPVAYVKTYVQPATSEAALRLGCDDRASFLQGTLDDVRLWKVGRLDWQIGVYSLATLPRDSEGLVSEWAFSTGNGRVAFDSKSDNNAIIKDSTAKLTDAIADTLWVPTTFRAAWRLYINGVEVKGENFSPPVPFRSAQCQIGAAVINIGVGAFFSGMLAELRTWNTVRTAEQISDTMFTPLAGNEDHLTGYWPMNDGSGEIVADRTGGGADGTWEGTGDTPPWITSTAPVGIEAPQVLSVPGGISNAGWQATIADTPAAGDYADVELGGDGGDVAAMKRAYAYVVDKTINAIAGFKTGDLLMQYIGQVQTKPTLIGYIEGAPPLPSENLTVDSPITPYKYLAASTITLTEADTATVTYSAERDRGEDFSMEFKAGLGFEWDFRAGIAVQSLLVRGSVRAGYHLTDNKALATLAEANISTTTSAVMSKTIEVFGSWQQNSYNFDPLVQRLYIPNNMGYALVKSGTADYFAIRLKSTGAVVKYTMQPNPDIPEDTNIIMFKIDPLYVKNGTLDGYVGFQPDKDYTFLTDGEKGSFFKPIEAYALKQEIEREQHQLLAAYDQFDATGLGRRFQYQMLNDSSPAPAGQDIGDKDADLTKILLQMQGGSTASSPEWRDQMTRRSLVNTYVWNSDGGLYSEEEQFSAVHEESLGGSYELVDKMGGYAEVMVSTGPSTSLDVLTGTHVRTKAMKRKTEGQSFGISVNLPGEGFLNKRKPPATVPAGEYPVPFEDFSCPGKVNQYRFMTFYLAPKKSNFETFWSRVVDQNWLNRQGPYVGSDDPDAFALRQARAHPNEVWRVLHRVTYVNRIPPAKGDAESIPADTRRPDDQSIAQNIWLITDLPVPEGDPTPLGTVYQELQPLLATLEQNPVWGALLVAQQATVADDIMLYMRGYLQVPS